MSSRLENPTIHDVAALANVSVATVSRVINKTHRVSDKLKARVHHAMDSLNYHPSNLARGLRRQKTHTVGILVPELGHPFFSQLTQAVEVVLFQNNYYCIACSVEENKDKERAYIETLLRQRVDGVIAVPTGQSDLTFNKIIDRGIPLVVMDRDLPSLRVNRVLCDNYRGAAEVARHLVSLGHKTFGLVGDAGYSESMQRRIGGVKDTIAADSSCDLATLPERPELGHFERGVDAAHRLLDQNERLTAFIALTDVIALGVIYAAAQRGLKVPDDISVTGFDDIALASYITPPLTTVRQPFGEMGRAAAQLLIEALSYDEPSTRTISFEATLKVRSTTRAIG